MRSCSGAMAGGLAAQSGNAKQWTRSSDRWPRRARRGRAARAWQPAGRGVARARSVIMRTRRTSSGACLARRLANRSPRSIMTARLAALAGRGVALVGRGRRGAAARQPRWRLAQRVRQSARRICLRPARSFAPSPSTARPRQDRASRAWGQRGLTLIDLPSSSPAYTLPFADKAARWSMLANFARPATLSE